MACEIRRPEGRINKLAREVPPRIERDLIRVQHAIRKSLGIGKSRVTKLSDSVGDVFAEMDKLASEFQRILFAHPGGGLKKLVEILRPRRLLAATWEDSWLILDLEAREGRLRRGLDIPSKPLRITRYTVVYKTGFRRHAGGPDANEIKRNVVVASRTGLVQLTGIRLSHGCEHVFVF